MSTPTPPSPLTLDELFRQLQALQIEVQHMRFRGVLWTCVTEGYPDDDTTVLVATIDLDVIPAYRSAGVWIDLSGMPIRGSVFDWCHLPEAIPF